MLYPCTNAQCPDKKKNPNNKHRTPTCPHQKSGVTAVPGGRSSFTSPPRMTDKESFELRAIHDARKSFGGKATVGIEDGQTDLYSYGTKVVTIDNEHEDDPNGIYALPQKVTLHPMWDSSDTTLRHVKEFLTQYGYRAGTLAEIREQYEQD
mgnify:CR=1 FL=1